ncbi:MAG TPA: M28 family peptidase, partial [Chitinophagaceae bacterium]|nr:M28 family peptidase [Chitinophagaceae bacterium]
MPATAKTVTALWYYICIVSKHILTIMKKCLFILALVPILAFSQTRRQRKAQEKADKETLTNLKANVMYLASDSLEGRRTGTPGELKAMHYVAGAFKKDGLTPAGSNGYIQEFEIKEGKQFTEGKNSCTVNGHALELKADYFPLAYSSNSTVEGEASFDLRERGEPWFFDVKEVLEENKNNPHFDINDAIIKEARRDKEKGATALVVINRSGLVDNIQFNKNDTTPLCSMPILYITADGTKKYFTDALATYNFNVAVNVSPKTRMAHNVIGYLNFNAPSTVILGAHFDHLGYGEDGNSLDGEGQIHNGADDNASGTSALIELGRILQNTSAHNNNYLFIAFSGEELGLFGSKYWLEHPTKNIVPNYMINMDMVGRYDSARKLTIGGYGTSPV